MQMPLSAWPHEIIRVTFFRAPLPSSSSAVIFKRPTCSAIIRLLLAFHFLEKICLYHVVPFFLRARDLKKCAGIQLDLRTKWPIYNCADNKKTIRWGFFLREESGQVWRVRGPAARANPQVARSRCKSSSWRELPL